MTEVLPHSVQTLARTLASQLSDYDRQLTETERTCGRYSAQLRFLELEPGIERSRRGLQRLRAHATELGPATLTAFDAAAGVAPDPDRWRPTAEDLLRSL